MQERSDEFHRDFLITPGLDPDHKVQTLRKIVYCVNMSRRFGAEWVQFVEPYLDDPLYNELLRYHVGIRDSYYYNRSTKPPPQREAFDVAFTKERLQCRFRAGRRHDVYDFTVWGLDNLNFNPHVIEEVGYPALLEERNYATAAPVFETVAHADLLTPPKVIPRRFTGFTRLSMTRTVCSVLQGTVSVDQIEQPQLAAIIRSAFDCKSGALPEERFRERLEEYVKGETERVTECHKAAIEFVVAIENGENIDELFRTHGGTGMARPTSHRSHADTPADIANRMMFYYRLCRKHGLLALETYRNSRSRDDHEPTWKKEPDPLIGLFLQLLSEGFGYEIDNINNQFSRLFQSQAEDRAVIAAWSLYAWGSGKMTVEGIATVLIDCLEEGRKLPKGAGDDI